MTESEKDEAREEFHKALKRIPPAVSCYSNGAICPWCGWLHATVTFGPNRCEDCSRAFVFGFPDWNDAKDGPVSWVNFPWKEFDAVGQRADALAPWAPNDRLKEIYFQKTEDRIGFWADTTTPN